MLATLEVPVGKGGEVRCSGEDTVVKWSCARCGRHLGDIRGTVLDEPNGNHSNLPCVRHCTRCKRRNVRLQ